KSALTGYYRFRPPSPPTGWSRGTRPWPARLFWFPDWQAGCVPLIPLRRLPMTIHHVRPGPGTLRGYLTRDLPPILTIDCGDRVCYQTLDAAWGALEPTFPLTEPNDFSPRDR